MKQMSFVLEFILGFTVVAGIFLVHTIRTSPGCIDNSFHANRHKAIYDYKNYHFVGDCDCPCERYGRLLDRGTCRKCRHFHVPVDKKLVIK